MLDKVKFGIRLDLSCPLWKQLLCYNLDIFPTNDILKWCIVCISNCFLSVCIDSRHCLSPKRIGGACPNFWSWFYITRTTQQHWHHWVIRTHMGGFPSQVYIITRYIYRFHTLWGSRHFPTHIFLLELQKRWERWILMYVLTQPLHHRQDATWGLFLSGDKAGSNPKFFF